MDIKDFILIAGGILIALVVGHGFWIAWKAKREPLRLDIVPDLIADDVDEIERLRGELPNGKSRVVQNRRSAVTPQNLELDLAVPVLMEPAMSTREFIEPPTTKPAAQPGKIKPRIHKAPSRTPVARDVNVEGSEPLAIEDAAVQRARVAEVQLEPEPIITEAVNTRRVRSTEPKSRVRTERTARKERSRQARVSPEPGEVAPVEELLIINILAPKGEHFDGEGLVNALRSQGLRYGEMNIFHRVDPATKAKRYSVANAVEPGTFDLSDLASMHSPGMTFFLQLPGPDDASATFEDMLKAARNVSVALGGELRDEDLNVLTGQTMEHMRQRIADFARRRLSKRA